MTQAHVEEIKELKEEIESLRGLNTRQDEKMEAQSKRIEELEQFMRQQLYGIFIRELWDLSNNKGLTGTLPSLIGNLNKLSTLILVGCSFVGPIPDSIGSLQQLVFLSLNSNSFSGPIPPSIGNLSSLTWLDLTDNMLNGTIPVSSGTTTGLDMLVNAKHFHLGRNQLFGSIPPQLFRSNMNLIHVIFDSNKLTGDIPSTLGYVQTLEVVRMDWNSLNGSVPSNLNKMRRWKLKAKGLKSWSNS